MVQPRFNKYPSKWKNNKIKENLVAKEPSQIVLLNSILLICMRKKNLYFFVYLLQQPKLHTNQ